MLFNFTATGYWIYRASNSEKNKFRHNPDDPALACLYTKRYFRNETP